MSVARATHAKRIAMMALMIGTMLLRRHLPQRALVLGVLVLVVVILTAYTVVVARILRSEGAGRIAVARVIARALLPIGSRLFLTRSGR